MNFEKEFETFKKRVPDGYELWDITYRFWGKGHSNTRYTATIGMKDWRVDGEIFQAERKTAKDAFEKALGQVEQR